ncbi:MAG: T9SS type A sorting domain-containing protein [Flavobacteriales bacterium]
MKIKSIFASLLISTTSFVYAQSDVVSTPSPELSSNLKASKVMAPLAKLANGEITETIIGTTTYDLQTNSAVQNRMVLHPGGEISAAWTMSLSTGDASFPDRGTGYNFYDGTSWESQPGSRIETERTGWPSIVKLTNGGEAMISHAGSSSYFAKRTTAGTGDWVRIPVQTSTADPVLDNVWHRMITGGTDGKTLHVIGGENLGNASAPDYRLRYSRSTDEGATWDIVNMALPGLEDSLYNAWSGDSYMLASKPNSDEVSMIIGGGDRDVMIMKSTDNGTTWTKNILWDFPIEKFDDQGDLVDTTTVPAVGTEPGGQIGTADGGYNLMYNNDGELMAFFGSYRMSNSDTNTAGTSFYPTQDLLFQWKESYGYVNNGDADPAGLMPGQAFTQLDTLFGSLTNEAVAEIDAGGIDKIANFYLSLTSMASTFVADNGDIWMTFSATTDLTEDQKASGAESDKFHRHQFITNSTDNGATWAVPRDLMSVLVLDDELYEGVFGNVVVNNGKAYVMYQRDILPGLNVRGEEHTQTDNYIIVAEFDLADYAFLDVADNEVKTFDIAPNPTAGNVKISTTLADDADVQVSITNMLGQEMFTAESNNNTVHVFDVNTSSFETGVYIVTLREGNNVSTQKLVVK